MFSKRENIEKIQIIFIGARFLKQLEEAAVHKPGKGKRTKYDGEGAGAYRP